MNKKTLTYLVAIGLLLVANLGMVFTKGLKKSSSFDDGQFLIQNIDEIASVSISQESGDILLEKSGDKWNLNGTYEADQSFLQLLFSILNQVKVKRVIGSGENTNSGNVLIAFNDGKTTSFGFASDPLGTASFFIEDGTSYQVEVPGYRDNVVNIFKLTEDQWRSRIVFDGSWRTIQRLNLEADNQNLNIRFNNTFFEVDGTTAIDSSAVVDYLNQFQVFQANEMISPGRFPELDSLMLTEPMALLSIDDIQSSEQINFQIYPALTNQNYHLVTRNSEIMMVFDRRRIQSLLKFNQDFMVN